MTSTEVRTKFKEFFISKGHAWIPSASLVPEDDPSILFTTAGMHPLVPYLLGEQHPQGQRLANIQRCLRTDDIDEVGDEAHLTFFEMLGFWSLGDYFKEKSIPYTWELFTGKEWLRLDPERMAVTVFAGDEDAPFDHEAEALWLAQPGFPGKNRIARMGKADNWWPTGGGAGGPCGPDTEVFYWTGEGEAPDQFDPTNKAWVEIGNNVFMQYNREPGGSYVPLDQRNVDTGLGFERIVTVAQGRDNVFETDLFAPVINQIRKLRPQISHFAERVIADHLRASFFLIMDGVVPSNKDQGYILRRLLRRSMAKINFNDVGESWSQETMVNLSRSKDLLEAVVTIYKSSYPELVEKISFITEVIRDEETKFLRNMQRGLNLIWTIQSKLKDGDKVSGDILFNLFATHGIPLELQEEYFNTELKFELDKKEFDRLFEEHQEKSRAGAEQKFKGGLADHSERVVRMHTATHLLHEALRRVLGEHVEQRGSNITDERLRFDFVQPQKLTDEQLRRVEDLVNDLIKQDLSVQREILSKQEALKLGARSIFGEKYSDQVSVYSVGPDEAGNYFSREFCGGPHVTHTAEIGQFEIVKEEAVSAGIRRIKATVR